MFKLTTEEEVLIHNYRALPEAQKRSVAAMTEVLADKQGPPVELAPNVRLFRPVAAA